jgi:hypothetical protein
MYEGNQVHCDRGGESSNGIRRNSTQATPGGRASLCSVQVVDNYRVVLIRLWKQYGVVDLCPIWGHGLDLEGGYS